MESISDSPDLNTETSSSSSSESAQQEIEMEIWSPSTGSQKSICVEENLENHANDIAVENRGEALKVSNISNYEQNHLPFRKRFKKYQIIRCQWKNRNVLVELRNQDSNLIPQNSSENEIDIIYDENISPQNLTKQQHQYLHNINFE